MRNYYTESSHDDQTSQDAPQSACRGPPRDGAVAGRPDGPDRSDNACDGPVGRQRGQWKHHLFAEVYQAKENDVDSADRLQLGYKVDMALTERLSVEAGQDNTLLAAITGLKVKMSDRLSLALHFAVRRNSDFRGALSEKTDRLTTINIVYGF